MKNIDLPMLIVWAGIAVGSCLFWGWLLLVLVP